MLRNLVIGICLLLASTAAWADDWPTRPVRLIVPYPPGGGADLVARVLSQKLGDALGQTFIVENKAGASGMVGAQTVAKGSPDGYTFLVATSAEVALNQNLFTDIAYDPLTDLMPVTLLAWTPLVLAAHPSLTVSTPAELIALARSQPLDFSIAGVGSAHHLAGEYINKLQSTRLVPVPYRGAAPAVSDTVSGHVKLTISGMPPVVPFLKSGHLKAIAVTSKRRSPAFPNTPAIAETRGLEDFDFTLWFGLLARSGTAQPIIDKLAKAAVAALQDGKVREVLETQAAVPVGNTPAEFGAFIRSESAKYAKIVELTGIKTK
ncbi:MAG TPA: tripartite tricarboxylate transporter substrate binding protein [Xanthobacteraceae bacterium]|jgi:tripartite-type tricarboxylate transporter receptor subunit TctC|nr:tripartite tricarboxylate transporter substrate binding protein [Xanthobacteraceae bacterium]